MEMLTPRVASAYIRCDRATPEGCRRTFRILLGTVANPMGLHERRPSMAAHRLTRRTFLQTAAAAAAGPFVSTPARAQGFNWKRFQGKELFLLLTKHPFIEVLEKHIPEFESLRE